MPTPADISRFIDDIASTMLDDILKSSSAEEMAQLIEELETKSGSRGYRVHGTAQGVAPDFVRNCSGKIR
jgi:hypothetical protein